MIAKAELSCFTGYYIVEYDLDLFIKGGIDSFFFGLLFIFFSIVTFWTGTSPESSKLLIRSGLGIILISSFGVSFAFL